MINGEITINLKEGLRSTKSKEIFFMIILGYKGLTYRVLSIVPQYKNAGQPGLAETGLKARTIRLISGMMDKTLLDCAAPISS